MSFTDKREEFLALLDVVKSVTPAARDLGINRNTAYAWAHGDVQRRIPRRCMQDRTFERVASLDLGNTGSIHLPSGGWPCGLGGDVRQRGPCQCLGCRAVSVQEASSGPYFWRAASPEVPTSAPIVDHGRPCLRAAAMWSTS